MSEAARLVDELTTLLYEVLKRWEVDGRVCEIVQCGACRRKADKPESVVHDSDCPVYRLIRAEEANTAVIRANAEEIADLEDRRDELEAQVNALTAERDAHIAIGQAFVDEINRVSAERDARVKMLENDLEHALASVGAFRAAIEDVWAKSVGESGEDGFVVSYVIPVGVLHRAIGMARGTDAGGKLLAERAESERPCTLALEYRDGVTCRAERDSGVCLNHRVIEGLRVHAVAADRMESAMRASLERMGRLLALTRTEQEVESLLRAALAASEGEG